MALSVTNLTRKFLLTVDKKNTHLDDPNPCMTVEEVMKFYAAQHPELTNAMASGPVILDGKAQYTFKTTAGRLG